MDTSWDSVREGAEMRVEAKLDELGLTLPEGYASVSSNSSVPPSPNITLKAKQLAVLRFCIGVRVAILYGPGRHVLCRHCYDLVYES